MSYIPPIARELSCFDSVEQFNHHTLLHFERLQHDFTKGYIKVFDLLKRYSVCKKGGTLGVSWMKRENMVEATGVSLATVERALAFMQQNGIIRIVPTKRKNGLKGNCYYTFLPCESSLEEIYEEEVADQSIMEEIAIKKEKMSSCNEIEGAEKVVEPLDQQEVQVPEKQDKLLNSLSSLNSLNKREEEDNNIARDLDIIDIKYKDLKNTTPEFTCQQKNTKKEMRSSLAPQQSQVVIDKLKNYSITHGEDMLVSVFSKLTRDLDDVLFEMVVDQSLKNYYRRLELSEPIFNTEKYFAKVVRNQIIPAQICLKQKREELERQKRYEERIKNKYIPPKGSWFKIAKSG